MESSGDAGDDQGSGWLQVKKKHRSSSKFSLQGWVGGFSGKHRSGVWHSRPPSNLKFENSHGKCDDQLSQAVGNSAVHCLGGITNSTFVSNKDEVGVDYLDKCVVSQDNECSNSTPSVTVDVTSCDFKTSEDKEYPQKTDFDVLPMINNPGVLPKIKWGDLDDGALIEHCGNNLGAQTNVGSIANDNSICRKVEDGDASVSNSFSSHSKGNTSVLISVDEDHVVREANSFSPGNKTGKDVNEVPSEDVKIQITNQKTQSLSGDVSSCQATNSGHFNGTKDSILSSSNLSGQNVLCENLDEAGVMMELPPPALICEAGDSKFSEVPVVDKALSTVAIFKDPELLSPEKNGPQTLGKSTVTASMEGEGGQKADMILDDLSKAQIVSAIAADDMGESKERFRQRLWCFLFENLNRAVDELYLLCELECDFEQMKEAILVLEEAASDFKELNSRVEEFEKVKRNSCQSIDGEPLTMKSDHRRPHALSWEVRRMTSSPHRAEILSSSLEAFRKIQQERASACSVNDGGNPGTDCSDIQHRSSNILEKNTSRSDLINNAKDSLLKPRKQSGAPEPTHVNPREKGAIDSGRSSRINLVQNGCLSPRSQSASDTNASRLHPKESFAASLTGKGKKEVAGSTSEMEKQYPKKDKMLTESVVGKKDHHRRSITSSEKDREKRNGTSWESMNAWKEKRNWEDILSSPIRVSSRFSHSPGMSRKSTERARVLHDKLMSPEKKKKTALDLKREAEEKHARAMRIRIELENERVQKLQRTSEKLNRVNEWQAVRSMKLRELMYARHQRSESRHEAFLAQVVRRAGDESSKVNEVRFITSLNEENKKLMLRQKLHDSELRRAEKLQIMRTKQKEDIAREEAVLGRKKLIEAEKLQRLVETQRRKEEAQVRREEERKASSAAREAKAMEQMRRKEERAKAQQEEAELLAQKLAERLTESEQRRKFYLEQIRERASMDFREQSSPLLRRSVNKDVQFRSTPVNNGEDCQSKNLSVSGGPNLPTGNAALQHSLKRRIKKIRQRLMSLKFEFSEASLGAENVGIGYRTAVATARAKMGRWLQELQRLRQARKEGAASIGLIISEIIKFMEGKDPELQASRQAGLIDFIASALPASHTSKPEACQVTLYFLRLLRAVLSVPANRSYFLAQNLLPPIIPMLAAALENYIKIAASSNGPVSTNLSSSKTSNENFESVSEVLDGFLWIVATIIGHSSYDDRQLQMQDGLLELVIAYQVIHRLRELFALYDRPQVEGSPFPSSILLSINLLVVLTSRFRTMSSIDWESFPVEKMMGNEPHVARYSDFVDSGCSSSCNSGEGHSSSLSALNDTIALALPDVPEDRPLDESCRALKMKDSFQGSSSNKVELNSTDIDTADIPDASQNVLMNGIAKCSVSQGDEDTLYKGGEINTINKSGLKQPVAFLLSAVSESGLVCLPSLLTAVLLQANNRNSSEQASYVLPSNFEEVATGVLRVLNNLALMDITFIQRMLARLDLKMEFFHLMSFLLSHCTSKWGVATDQIGLLLLESLLLLGYFSLFHPENQAVLRWGKSPTILHKVCDLPFVFFSDPELMRVLAGTLVAACFGCEQNKAVVQQELSIEMILSLLRSCRNGLPAINFSLALENPPKDESGEPNHLVPESRKHQSDIAQRISRSNLRNTRVPYGRVGASSNTTRTIKMRNQKDSKAVKVLEEMALKHDLLASEASSTLMLHSRFRGSFIDKAEQFFSTEVANLNES